jgi:glycosyltransferase involved in cell wall biosynthesis
MDRTTKIYCIIATYNAEKWIGDCIQSAVAQIYQEKEIIVVDDGSSDATLKIALSYASSRVNVVSKRNQGASSARNFGLKLAQGDYIQWLDADDLLHEAKIQTQMLAAEAGRDESVLFSGAWGRFDSSPEKACNSSDLLWEDLAPVEWIQRKVEHNLWVPPMVFLVSRQLTQAAGPWNEELKRDNDGEYFLRVISQASRITFLQSAKCYKRSTFGISHQMTLSDQKLESIAYSLLSHVRTLQQLENSPRTRNACLKLLNRWTIYFFPERADLLAKMRAAANELGGELEPPRLRTKYRWIQKVFGWKIGKKAQFTFGSLRQLAGQRLKRLGL